MKILRVIPTVNPAYGGPIEGITQITKVIDSQGHNTAIVCLDTQNDSWVKEYPIRTYALGPPVSGYYYSKRLVPWLRRNAPAYDCVIVHGVWQYLSFATWLALHKTKIPYFVYTHGMLDPWFKRTYPLKHLKKCLYWPWAEYRVLRDAAGVCFTCEEERVLARQSFTPYKCHEIVVNYGTAQPTGNPDAQRETFLTRFPELRSKRLVLFLSRIHVKKGCDLLIEAFARVAGLDDTLHLVMAGPDHTGWRAQLQAQAESLGIADRIAWTGMLSGDLKWGAFHAAEAFVLPSHQENFGIAIVEAMACGLPVLISNKVNIWREIERDGAGLVAEDTAPEIARLLREWLALPDEDKHIMRQRAEQCFAERFEIHKAATSLLDVLRR